MKDKNKIVGECKLCKDPIYAFQLVKDNMHEGCSKLTKEEVNNSGTQE